MTYYLKTAPTVEPMAVAEIKSQLRIDVAEDDPLLVRYIRAAREEIERRCRPRRALISQTWQYIADRWPSGDTLELEVVPLISVSSIVYIDEDGGQATLSASSYLVDTYSEIGRIRLKTGESWPSVTLRELNGISVEFLAGYGTTAGSVPETLRQALALLVGHWYENREASMAGAISREIPMAVSSLLRPYQMRVG